jgi:hypothetical protein
MEYGNGQVKSVHNYIMRMKICNSNYILKFLISMDFQALIHMPGGTTAYYVHVRETYLPSLL